MLKEQVPCPLQLLRVGQLRGTEQFEPVKEARQSHAGWAVFGFSTQTPLPLQFDNGAQFKVWQFPFESRY